MVERVAFALALACASYDELNGRRAFVHSSCLFLSIEQGGSCHFFSV